MRRVLQEDPKLEFELLIHEISERWKLAELERAHAQQCFSDSLYLACRQRGIPWPSNNPVGVIGTKYPDLHGPLLLQAREGLMTREASFKQATERLKRRACALASLCSIAYLSEPTSIYFTAYASAYGSQGTGALFYAEGRAMQEKWVIGYVDPQVVCEIEQCPTMVHVRVNLSEVDTNVLKYRAHHHGMPLREYIRRLCVRSFNPRVYNPFLPHDTEDKLGIIGGNDIKSATYVCNRCGRKFKNAGRMLECNVCGFDLAPLEVIT